MIFLRRGIDCRADARERFLEILVGVRGDGAAETSRREAGTGSRAKAGSRSAVSQKKHGVLGWLLTTVTGVRVR